MTRAGRIAAGRGFAAWNAGNALGPWPLYWHGTDVGTPFNLFARWEEASVGFHFGTAAAAETRLAQIAEGGGEGAFLLPVLVRAERPLRLADHFTWQVRGVLSEMVDAGAASPDLADWVLDEAEAVGEADWALFGLLEELGHDAVVYGNVTEGGALREDSLFVWRAEQLKSPFAASFRRGDPRLLPQAPADPGDLACWRAAAAAIDEWRQRISERRPALAAAL